MTVCSLFCKWQFVLWLYIRSITCASIQAGPPLTDLSTCFTQDKGKSWTCEVIWSQPKRLREEVSSYVITWKNEHGNILQEIKAKHKDCKILCVENCNFDFLPYESCMSSISNDSRGEESCVTVLDTTGRIETFYQLRVGLIFFLSLCFLICLLPRIRRRWKCCRKKTDVEPPKMSDKDHLI